MASSNPNSSFFNSSYKHAWKSIMPQGLSEAEADLVAELAGSEGKVLDLMCGHGRHALALARRGFRVTAIDNLPHYIEEIRNTAAAEGLPIEAILADALLADPGPGYNIAICMGNSFAFFNREEAVQVLKMFANSLVKGGVLLINSWMIAEIAIRHFRERDWHYAGSYKCVLEYRYCFHPSRIESEQTIISEDGQVEVLKGVDYIFTLDEMEEMFKEAGLKTKHMYSTPRKKQFRLGDGQIYLVAEKQ